MGRAAIVIGSGPNGLAAAITLAQAGRDVLVLESAARCGGAVVTEELTLPGFLHDTFSSVYPAGHLSPVFQALPLARHGLRWVHPRACYAHPLPDGRAIALYRDLSLTAADLDATRVGDGERWANFVQPWLAHFDALRRTLLSGFPPLRGPLMLAAGLGGSSIVELARLALMPADALAQELFGADASRAWLYGSALHSDASPAAPGSAIAALYLMLLGHGGGWPSPEGGSGRLTHALVAHLLELGGRVRTGARVARVVVARGRVQGVTLAGGERLGASLVVADVLPAGLLRLAADALPGRYRAALARYRPGPSTLKVDWALDGPIPWSAAAARTAGTVHVGGGTAELLAASAPSTRLPERPFLLLGQQSLADPTRAPAGKHTAWAYTRGPQTLDWDTEQDRHVERMEAQVERFAPGFRDLILARHVQGPADLERANANLVGGDVGAGSYALDQLVFRPLPSLAPYRTPVTGLYLGSAATFPGAGVHGVPGRAAARLALAEARVRRL
jgi:phytoene dehydrogenase-like protein